MNLEKLFEMQKVLDERIIKEKGLEGQDLLPEKYRALLTELGELSNEERGFKYWKSDRTPRTSEEVECNYCGGTGTPLGIPDYVGIDCWKCDGAGFYYKNPLLEEYVDCLHFILSIGLQLKDKFALEQLHLQSWQSKEKPIDITTEFNELFASATSLYMSINDEYYENADRQGIYEELFERFLSLGEMLGFTWEQIEQAYFEKNHINHERQANGY